MGVAILNVCSHCARKPSAPPSTSNLVYHRLPELSRYDAIPSRSNLSPLAYKLFETSPSDSPRNLHCPFSKSDGTHGTCQLLPATSKNARYIRVYQGLEEYAYTNLPVCVGRIAAMFETSVA